jgi:hypothetical protein
MNASDRLISFLPLIFIGLAAVISTRAFFQGSSQSLKMFSRLCILTFVVELVGHLTKEAEVNYWIYNVFHVVYYIYLASIFYHTLKHDTVKSVIPVFYVTFFLFVVYNSLFLQGILSLQTYTLVLGGGFMMFLAGAYFWELFVSTDNESIARDPFFWFSFGFLLYFGGTVPFLGMFNYLSTNFYDFTVFYYTNFSNAFSILLSLLIMVGFLCRKSYQKLS